MSSQVDKYRLAQAILKSNKNDKDKAMRQLANKFYQSAMLGKREDMKTAYEVSLCVLDLVGEIPEQIVN